MWRSGLTLRQCRQLTHTPTIVPPRSFLGSPTSRSFHATAPRKDNTAYELLLYLPHELLESLHSCGLPWAYAIPASALIVRTLMITLPYALGQREQQQRYLSLNPIREALGPSLKSGIVRKGDFDSPKQAGSMARKAANLELAALHKRWNCTLPKRLLWPFLNIPIFILMADTIRNMCGSGTGLLGLVMRVVPSGEELKNLPEFTSGVVEEAKLGGSEIQPSPLLDFSFANEGMLWFPNLMVPDPYLALPSITGGLLLAQIWLGSNRLKGVKPTRGTRIMRKVLTGVAISFPYVMLNVPAGILLYWISSTSSYILWNKLMDIYAPYITPPTACKRPLTLLPMPRTR